jgi:hypothetical protein
MAHDCAYIYWHSGTGPTGREPPTQARSKCTAIPIKERGVPSIGFSLPDGLFNRLFNLHTGTLHDFDCPVCNSVTKHFSTTHSALKEDNVLIKILSRIFEDLSGMGNLLEGKPYVCTVCRTIRFE